MISFCSSRKLSSYSVRKTLYLLERTVGSFHCKGKRCKTSHNINKIETFNSTTKDENFNKKNYKINCNDTVLVDLSKCKAFLE